MLSSMIAINLIMVFVPLGGWKGSVHQETDIISLIVYLAGFIGGIIVYVWVVKKWMDEDTLKTFREKFLKFEREKREKWLKKYVKIKNDDEQWTARHVFFEYFKDISKDTREEIFEYLVNNIKTIKRPFQKEIEIRNLLEILNKYFNDISHSIRNDVLLKMIEMRDFRVVKVIRNHLREIPVEILNKAFIEFGEEEEMMEILNDYDESTCMDEKIKEEALKKYVETKWINANVEILKKFLERGIEDKKLREDIFTILALKKERI